MTREKSFQMSVYYARRRGKLKLCKWCARCKRRLATLAHHPVYREGYRLVVYWMCDSCHRKVHCRRLSKWFRA